jgi:hypothetical protein
MRLKIENGYYKFYPVSAHELDLLAARGIEVVMHKDFFTFKLLKRLPMYSIEGIKYGGLKAKTTYSGTVEQVLFENKFVYDLGSKAPGSLAPGNFVPSNGLGKEGSGERLKDVSSITNNIEYGVSDKVYFEGIPQIGGFMKDRRRLRGFSGYWKIVGSGIITAESLEYYVD